MSVSSYRLQKTNQIMSDDSIKILSIEDMYNLFNSIEAQYDRANLKMKLRNNHPRLFKSILTYYNKIYKNFCEISYLLNHKTLQQPKCKYCDNLANFRKDNTGYSNGCSVSCNFKYSNEVKRQHKTSIKGNLKLSDIELKTELFAMLKDKHSRGFSDTIYAFNKELIPLIYTRTIYLPKNCKLNERIYHVLNDLDEISICKKCNKNKLKFNTFVLGYRDQCADCGREISGVKGSIALGRSLRLKYYESWMEKILPDFEMLNSKENYISTGIMKMKHKKCGHIHERRYAYANGCPRCFAAKHSSEPEQEIKQFIMDNTDAEVISRHKIYPVKNRRKSKELDIYIPSLQLAIEYNGLYWHSEIAGKSKTNHLDKTIACQKEGIQLIHIFENEWRDKRDIIKSILLSKMNKYDVKLYGRKCQLKEIDTKVKNSFLSKNHLQGADTSKIKIGLFYDNILVAVMTFGKRKITGAKKITWEMFRYASKLNHCVVGGASKLFKYFLTNYITDNDQIKTYADRRFSNGNLYKTLGFKLSHASRPSYWYFKRDKFYNRMNFQKQKLNKKLDIFDKNLTEWENMLNNGYNRIFDCGNLVYFFNT